jgi:hypothetical protein
MFPRPCPPNREAAAAGYIGGRGGVGIAGNIGDKGSSIGSGGSHTTSSSLSGCTRPLSCSTDSGDEGGGNTLGSFESWGEGGVVMAVDVGNGFR